MKEVEKKHLPEIPGGVQAPYPGGTDVGPDHPRIPFGDEQPCNPLRPDPLFE